MSLKKVPKSERMTVRNSHILFVPGPLHGPKVILERPHSEDGLPNHDDASEQDGSKAHAKHPGKDQIKMHQEMLSQFSEKFCLGLTCQ